MSAKVLIRLMANRCTRASIFSGGTPRVRSVSNGEGPTRLQVILKGANSRAIITGDITQVDLPQNQSSGLIDAMNILEGIDGIAFCRLTRSDVVRHRLVKDILKAYDSNGEK